MSKSLTHVWINQSDLDPIAAEAVFYAPKETGGIFMGYRTGDSIVITSVIGSGPLASRSAVHYKPDEEFEQNEIARVYESSGRLHSYLGDWHTHPGGILRLSRKDKSALTSIAKYQESGTNRPIMAILAGQSDDWRLAIWEYLEKPFSLFRAKMRLTKLRVY